MAPIPTTFEASAPVSFTKGTLGLYFAWAAFSKRDGHDFYDGHGDHIPEDDLVAGALSLSQVRLLKVEHDGEDRGDIPLVYPLTTDIAAALGVTSKDSGLLIGFRPDVDLAADIDAGTITELSIAGEAMAELVKAAIEKADADGPPTRKRKLTQPRIDEVSLVKRGAHGRGTKIAIAKRAEATRAAVDQNNDEAAVIATIRKSEQRPVVAATPARTESRREPIAKGAHPALTTATSGHTHLIYDVDCEGGSTSYEHSVAGEYRTGHSHPWVRTAAGISIGEADGHSHDVATESTPMSKTDPTPTAPPPPPPAPPAAAPELEAATQRLRVLKSALATALTAPADQRAFAARLDDAGREMFLARGETERAAEVKDAVAHVSISGEIFYKSDDARLVQMAKRDDDREIEFAKTREAAELASFEKRASAELPHTDPRARARLLKAAEAIGPEAVEALKAGDVARGMFTKTHGHSHSSIASSALEKYQQGLATFAKTKSKAPGDVAGEYLGTDEGAALYQSYRAEQRSATH